ncbi:MAG: hypothetical protein OIN83_10945, partial [Candidatus Methanoperedens sp.]|nr:hypothetical protein [Candidatus Methanoperedens sp.]
ASCLGISEIEMIFSWYLNKLFMVLITTYHYAYPLKWYLNNSFFGIGIAIAKGLIHPLPLRRGLLHPLNHGDQCWIG